MYCEKCGKKIDDNAMICPECGCATSNFRSNRNIGTVGEEKSTLATLSIVFAVIMPIVGLVLGIIGVCKYQNEEYKERCNLAIKLSIGLWIISFILLSVLYSTGDLF